jgi:hypothetical protein
MQTCRGEKAAVENDWANIPLDTHHLISACHTYALARNEIDRVLRSTSIFHEKV